MFINIFTKTIRDRWLGTSIATVTLVLFVLMAMAFYRDIDLSFYTELPEVFRQILGVPPGVDVASLGIGVMVTSYGAWILAGLMIAAGSASIASEESNGTIGILLGNPKSRTNVLLSKAASMLLLAALAVAGLFGSIYLIVGMFDISITGLNVGALNLHLFFNVLFYGSMAMAIGAWTGNRGTAVGATVGLMVVSIFAVGILPLVEGLEGIAKVFPWYYFNSSEPLFNGINWGHIAVLCIGIALFVIAAVIGVNRRDLKSQNIGVTLLDRLRNNRITQNIIERLAGSTRVSHIWTKTLSEHQGILVITGCIMFLVMGLMIGPIYNFIPEELFSLTEDFPETLLVAFGGGNMSTPEGFYQIETFGLMAPIALIVVTITVGARALAGEEGRHTMSLLLANPIKRSRIVIEKAWVMVVCAFTVGFAIFAGVWLGSLIGGLGMDVGNIAATCLLVTLLGMMIGALALALSAATGQTKVAVYCSIGASLLFYVISTFFPLNENLAGYAKWSPYYYYLSSDPLLTGMNWGHGAILAGLTLGLFVLSIALFQRRDLR